MKKFQYDNIAKEWQDESDPEAVHSALRLMQSNPDEGLRAIEALAKSGSRRAMVTLGDTYLYGRGVVPDVIEGQSWLSRARDLGSIEGGYRLARHKQISGKTEEAIDILQQLGWENGFAPALYTLGNIYYKGDGVESDLGRAMEYWSAAEQHGHLVAAHWNSWALRKHKNDILSKIKGYIKLVSIMVPFIYNKVFNPTSDRVRNW